MEYDDLTHDDKFWIWTFQLLSSIVGIIASYHLLYNQLNMILCFSLFTVSVGMLMITLLVRPFR